MPLRLSWIHEAFSSLAWNDKLDWWSGAAEFKLGHHIDVHVQTSNDPDDLRAAVERAAQWQEWLNNSEGKVRAAVAAQMTAARNEYCAEEDEVTPEQFAERLRLLSILFEKSAGLELCYHDGMLLGGHRIILPIARDGTVGEATEAG